MAAPQRIESTVRAEAAPAAVIRLLKVEGDARAAESVPALAVLIANETRKLARARQAFVFRKMASGTMQIEAGSAMNDIDRQVPLIQYFERMIKRVEADVSLDDVREFSLTAYNDVHFDEASVTSYPFGEALWFPLQDRSGVLFAGVLLMRETPWTAAENTMIKRLRVTFSHAWYWVATSKGLKPRFGFSKLKAAVCVAAFGLISIVPVSLTTLAPLEVTARDALLVTAPMDGVIEEIVAVANKPVVVGDVLLRFSDTTLRNRLEVAKREMEVARARVKKTTLLAIASDQARHDLTVARAELTVRTAEYEYARDLLGKAVVRATKTGVAIIGDKRELLGKPIATGERIMEIADPSQVEVRIDVPVSDAIILGDDKRAKLFLDSDPLHPREAVVVRSDYQAKSTGNGALAFRTVAHFEDTKDPPPRLGIRGTAQLYGEQVPLIYYILRRPFTYLRQWIGM